ncbi:hypothetical protein F5Y18DRAFT_422660 [Xylariaceae sp. FL1019]|nr:hypothetical protein F5Y18DRAFT_422660 [Xylariaceae sp. FL1019]
MLTTTHVDHRPMWTPLGTRPAVDLAQSMPPGMPADILMLGCGDVRNLLFTIHNNTCKLDFTCCDNHMAVIARNILLLSLIIDEAEDGKPNGNCLWEVYHNAYINKESFDLIATQSKKLQHLSVTLDIWRQGKYGPFLGICDSSTLRELGLMWKYYADACEKIQTGDIIGNAHKIVLAFSGFGLPPTAQQTEFDAAAPAQEDCKDDIKWFREHFFKHGTTELDAETRSISRIPNVTFHTLNDGGAMDYYTNPVRSYHLRVDVPLKSDDDAFSALPRRQKYVTIARREFSDWVTSYKKHFRNDLSLRLFVGDAISLAYTLQYKRSTGRNTANFYRDRLGLSPLVLDGLDYHSDTAPVDFDVIDTSDLCDYIGPLTLLTATSPLLRNRPSAVLYTETFSRDRLNGQQALEQILCGNTPTIAAVLDLFPVGYWTNTSPISLADSMVDDWPQRAEAQSGEGNGTRLPRLPHLQVSWKRSPATMSATEPYTQYTPLHFEPQQLAKMLHGVYCYMFPGDDILRTAANMNYQSTRPLDLLGYQRSSFAAFLQLVQTRVVTDWNAMMRHTLGLIKSVPNPLVGMTMTYLEELYVYLHTWGVFTTDLEEKWNEINGQISNTTATISSLPASGLPPAGDDSPLRRWKSIPHVVCVVLEIPRGDIASLVEQQPSHDVTMSCRISRSGSHMPSENRRDSFAACQWAYGDLTTSGLRSSDSYQVQICEHYAGLWGNRSMIAVFYVPSALLIEEPHKATVSCLLNLMPTNMAAAGTTLRTFESFFSTSLINPAVHITKFGPNLTGLPVVVGIPPKPRSRSCATQGVDAHLVAGVDAHTRNLVTLTARIDITSDDLGQALRNGCEVKETAVSPCQTAVTIGKDTSVPIFFPTFMYSTQRKLRIARKSSWIEVIVKVAGFCHWMQYAECAYTMSFESGKPVSWTLPYINLDRCPKIADPAKLPWLDMHIQRGISRREEALMKKEREPWDTGEELGFRHKEAIIRMLIKFSGGPSASQVKHFGYFSPPVAYDLTGLRMLIRVSALRLDLANRTVALDCAVVPNQPGQIAGLTRLLADMERRSAIDRVPFHPAHLFLWKYALPMYVERCRSWDHKETCEYGTASSFPIFQEGWAQILCTCGNGIFPPNFFEGDAVWENRLSRHAVRAVLEVPFYAPYMNEPGALDPVEEGCWMPARETNNTVNENDADAPSIVPANVRRRTGERISWFARREVDVLSSSVREELELWGRAEA